MQICGFEHGDSLLDEQQLLDQRRDHGLFRRFLIVKDEFLHVDRDVEQQATNAILLDVSIVIVAAVFKLKGFIVADKIVVAHEEGRANDSIIVAFVRASIFEGLEAELKAFTLHGGDETIDVEVFVQLQHTIELLFLIFSKYNDCVLWIVLTSSKCILQSLHQGAVWGQDIHIWMVW